MPELPSGEVTLLFSDIEGSTNLLSRLGPEYADALDTQRRVLREAWSAWGGIEMGTEGDSFYVVFAEAKDAVAAAAQGQRALAAASWPGGENVRVRIGTHTGTPALHDGAYVGMDVHIAARIAGAAYGGQTLISARTAEALASSQLEGVTLADLGGHRLKDIAETQRILQVSIDGLPHDFPQLKTISAFTSLPSPVTELVGRETDAREMGERLLATGTRVVTLTGPGGTGKTRLSIEIARRAAEHFLDGVYFVALAVVTEPELMWTAIGETVGVPAERRNRAGIVAEIGQRRVLLVLDNLEQLDGAGDVVAELIAAAPNVVVLASSRRRLQIDGEHERPVAPLGLPVTVELGDASESGAVQMFVQHAAMANSRFTLSAANVSDVVEICRRLDGLPLAIELAAARSKLLSPSALVKRLSSALEFSHSTASRPDRQQTLRDAIAWSYELLEPEHQHLFERLGVLSGGGDLDAVEALVGPDAGDPIDSLEVLVDASLVTVAESLDGEPRFGMLETIKAFALDVLASDGLADSVRAAHAEHFNQVATTAWSLMESEEPLDMAAGGRLFRAEIDNFRAALHWTLDDPNSTDDRVSVGTHICASLKDLWADLESYEEAVSWALLAVERSEDAISSDVATCYFMLAFALPVHDGNHIRARDAGHKCVEIWRELDDDAQLAVALIVYAMTEQFVGGADLGRKLFVEAETAAHRSGESFAQMMVVWNWSNFEMVEGDLGRATELADRALEWSTEIRDPYGIFQAEHVLGRLALLREDVAAAEELLLKQLEFVLEFAGSDHLMEYGEDLASTLAALGRWQDAAVLLGATEAARSLREQPRHPNRGPRIDGPIEVAQTLAGDDAWDQQVAVGRDMTVHEALESCRQPA